MICRVREGGVSACRADNHDSGRVGVALATVATVTESPDELEPAATTTAVEDALVEEPAPEPKPEAVSQNGDEDWGYTPMSQWGIDE